MEYDDAPWHYGRDYPKDLLKGAGTTHISMFVAWAVLNGLGGELHTNEFPDNLAILRRREMTPGQWFLSACDGKFVDEDLSDEGNRFAEFYYDYDQRPSLYLADYEKAFPRRQGFFGTSKSLDCMPDTWETFAEISPLIDARYADWSRAQ